MDRYRCIPIPGGSLIPPTEWQPCIVILPVQIIQLMDINLFTITLSGVTIPLRDLILCILILMVIIIPLMEYWHYIPIQQAFKIQRTVTSHYIQIVTEITML